MMVHLTSLEQNGRARLPPSRKLHDSPRLGLGGIGTWSNTNNTNGTDRWHGWHVYDAQTYASYDDPINGNATLWGSIARGPIYSDQEVFFAAQLFLRTLAPCVGRVFFSGNDFAQFFLRTRALCTEGGLIGSMAICSESNVLIQGYTQ